MGLFGVKKDPPRESKKVYQVETRTREVPPEKAYEVEKEQPQQQQEEDTYQMEPKEEQKDTSFFDNEEY